MYKIIHTATEREHQIILKALEGDGDFVQTTLQDRAFELYNMELHTTQYFYFRTENAAAQFLFMYGGVLKTDISRDKNVQNYLARKLQGTE